MASLSNINGIFDVHSTGAIQFNGNHGASGQILKSNGNAAPTWVDASTVIGGPYLPLAGGTLTGATATASGVSFTVGGILTLQGSGGNTTTFDTSQQQLIIKNSAYTTASGLALRSSNNTWQMQLYASGGGTDYGFLASEWGAWNMRKNNSGGLYLNNNTTYFVQPEGTSNMNAANFAGYVSGITPTAAGNFATKAYVDAHPGSGGTVTSVATSNGITGGTITATGTVSLTGTYSGRWNATSGYYIDDTRAGVRTPGSWNDHSMDMFFTNQIPGNSNWLSGIQMGGWSTSSYASWQLIGPSTTTAYDTWYLRSGIGSSWNTPRQIWHTGNLPNPVQGGPYLPLAGGTMTGSLNMGNQSITGATNIYNSAWFRNSNSSEGLYNSSTGNHWSAQGGYWDTGLNGTQGIRLRNGHNGAIMGYLYSETTGQFGLLDKDGNWTFRTDGDTITELRCNNAVGFQMDASGYLTFPVNLDLSTTAPTKVFMSNNAQVKTCDLQTSRAQFNLSYSNFRRYDYTTDTNYSTNIVGWGNMNLNSTIPGLGSGFWDQWGTAGADGQPSNETSHWQGSQAFHYVRRADLGNIYGYQTAVGAGDPAKMYVRGCWSGTSWGSWYRMHNDKTALIKINNQVSISTYNERNLKIQGGGSGTDTGITGYAPNGGHVWQLYGAGNDYGFLNGNWAAWDLRKTKNGNLYLNNQSTYYLNPSSTSICNDVRANIYYDQANTAYYTRPATSSYINTLHTAGQIQVGSSGSSQLYLGGTSGNYFRFHTNNSDTYFDANVGNIYWRQGSSTRFYFYMTTANMTINGSLTQNSDVRVKENIIEISNCIDKVKAIRGVYYNRTDFNTKATKVGVVAQEVEKVLPEVILEAPDTGLKSVAYAELTPVLINAIKEQQVMIDDLKSRVKELENK